MTASAAPRWSTTTVLVASIAAGLVGFFCFRSPVPTAPDVPSLSVSPSHSASTPSAAPSGATTASEVPKTATLAPWKDRWETANAARHTPARTRELSALLEELARSDAPRALALAAAADDWRLRDLLRDAALRGWASSSPDDAGDFALTLRPEDRRAAVAAVMQGAASRPADAVNLAVRLCRADPEPAGDYGHAAIAALVDAGAFTEAVRFGQLVGTEKFPFLAKSAFFQWARNQPDQALAAAAAIENPSVRAQARGEVISGWAWADARGLAEHAQTLPPGTERNEAMSAALPLWVERDPTAALTWISAHDSGPEFDHGLAAVAQLQSFVVQQPTTALGLASDISDRALRSHTQRSIFRQWALRDRSAALAYFNAHPGEQTTLRSEIEDLIP